MVFIFVSSIGIFFACLIYKILSRLIRDQLLDTLTPLNDFHFLAKQRDANKRIPGTAVIAGGRFGHGSPLSVSVDNRITSSAHRDYFQPEFVPITLKRC